MIGCPKRYSDVYIGESNVSSYVRALRYEYKIPKEKTQTHYEDVLCRHNSISFTV